MLLLDYLALHPRTWQSSSKSMVPLEHVCVQLCNNNNNNNKGKVNVTIGTGQEAPVRE